MDLGDVVVLPSNGCRCRFCRRLPVGVGVANDAGFHGCKHAQERECRRLPGCESSSRSVATAVFVTVFSPSGLTATTATTTRTAATEALLHTASCSGHRPSLSLSLSTPPSPLSLAARGNAAFIILCNSASKERSVEKNRRMEDECNGR